jgi:peptidoglycan hydrolase CwlO-like protein
MEQKKETFLKRSISVGELIAFGVSVAAFLITTYTSNEVRFNSLELRMNNQENQYNKVSSQLERIESKQDETKESINNLEKELINKQDRKN